MPLPQKGLRKREIVFAVAMGALAAGGAALTFAAFDDDPMVQLAGPGDLAAGSGEMTYELAPFDEISTAGPQIVQVTYGEEFSVRSEGPPEALALLEATVENGRLSIGPANGFNWLRWGRLEGATFYVTMPRLTGITTAGSGSVHADRIVGDSFEGKVGGPGEISIGELEVDEATFTVAGSGNFVAAGAARETRVTIAGSGEIQAAGLRSETASISIGGSGDVSLTVDKDAQVSITGSGDVDISGPASCSVTRMGGGEVRCNGVEIEAN